MKLHNFIPKKCIIFIEGNRPKKEIIEYLLSILYDHSNLKHEEMEFDEILKELLKREKEQTTAIGNGFAFPHARLNNLKGVYTLIAVSKKGIDYDSLDGNPVNFIVLSLVSRLNPAILLKSRASIISILSKKEIQKRIFNLETPEAIREIFIEQDIELDKELCAKDIMYPQIGKIDPEMTLYEAARELHRFHSDSLPLIDRENNFIGDISCHDLFSYKLPNFFKTLHTISFIKHMNPFEKYFQADTTKKIKDLTIERTPTIIKPDATIMEIIFEITVKNKEVLYIVEDKKLLGSIDRYSIIDKILISNISGVH